jgi:hypothetical protein
VRGVHFVVRVDGVAGDRSQSATQAQHAMEAEAERARVEACGTGARIKRVEGGGAPHTPSTRGRSRRYRLEQKAKAEEREEKRKQKAAKDRQRKQEAEERRRKLKALS